MITPTAWLTPTVVPNTAISNELLSISNEAGFVLAVLGLAVAIRLFFVLRGVIWRSV